MPIHGEVHTISGGFPGGGCTASQLKRYVWSVNSVAEQGADDSLDVDLTFTKADLHDVVPHDNDPVVISVGRRVHRVLVDQGSSTDVMFWSTFNKLQLSPDLLRPYIGCLYGFTGGPSGGARLSSVEDDFHGWHDVTHREHKVFGCER